MPRAMDYVGVRLPDGTRVIVDPEGDESIVVHESGAQTFRIEPRDGKFVVTTDDGKRVLGTHDTKEEAQAQLRAIEVAKEQALEVSAGGARRVHPRAGVARFDGLRGDDGKVRAGVWDYVCVAGTNVKDDEETTFDENTLGQMCANFEARGDLIPLDWNHQSNFTHENGQPAPALAYYGALATVFGGKILHCVYARGVETAPPDPSGKGDGLWAYRCEVTEFGDKLLPSFKYVSPTFSPEGTDQQDNPIGYVLMAVAATNTPFQAGTELTFERGQRARKGRRNMAAKLIKMSKWVKFDDDADDKTIKQAVMQKMEEAKRAAFEDEGYDFDGAAKAFEEMARAYEDAHYEDGEGGENPDIIMRKMAAKFRRQAKLAKLEDDEPHEPGDEPEHMEDEEEQKAMQALAQKFGLDPKASRKEILQAVAAGGVSLSQIPGMVDKQVKQLFDAEKKKRDDAEAKERAEALAQAAIDGGYAVENKAELVSFARTNYGAAEKLVAPFIKDRARLFERVTRAGGPAGSERSSMTTGDTKVQKFGAVTVVKHGCTLSQEAKKLSREKGIDYEKALDQVVRERPELYQQYLDGI